MQISDFLLEELKKKYGDSNVKCGKSIEEFLMLWNCKFKDNPEVCMTSGGCCVLQRQ